MSKTFKILFSEDSSYYVNIKAKSLEKAKELFWRGDYEANDSIYNDTIDRQIIDIEEIEE